MDRLVLDLVVRLRPRVGWPIALLAIAAACAPGLAAYSASLALPATPLLWAGLLGAALGLRMARPMSPAWRALTLCAWITLGLLLLLAAGGALPPLGLIAQDVGSIVSAIGARMRGAAPAPPELLTGRYLGLALPRLWGELLAAPQAGERGAALIVAALAVAITWPAALTLGWAAGGLRQSLGWGAPLLVALASTTILGGSGGGGLAIGVGTLLVLNVAIGAAARERRWEREGYAYAELLRPAAIGWGVGSATLAVLLALLIPTSLPNLAASLPESELPSGIAAIEGRVQRGAATATPDPGRSQLEALLLGTSLEERPPGAVSLRVMLDGPLAAAPYPRYWRTLVLSRYTGRSWTSDARRGSFAGLPIDERPAGAILQRVEDLRPPPGLVAGLPEVVGLDRAAVAERLPDGSLAALELEPGARSYTLVSLPQELAPTGGAPGEPPQSYSDALNLPGSVPQRVRDLAQAVAGSAGTQREQALALEAYLRGLPYSYEVRPLPQGGDAVDQFVFEMRHGYCTYYASAMAVMARTLGIPARVAVGYATGTFDPVSSTYTVREGDAHAWPELLIEGRWLPFEPTPVRPLPPRDLALPQTPPTPIVEAEPTADARATPLWALAALVALGAAIAAGLLLWRSRRLGPLASAQLRLERLGARAGVPWPAGATLREYGRLLAGRGALAGATGAGRAEPAIDELIALIEGARYGHIPLGPEQERRLRLATRELRRRLKHEKPRATSE